jgi:hypothetical protein
MLFPNSDEPKYVSFQFQNPKNNVYLACYYTDYHIKIILHAEGAIACGDSVSPLRVACWITDPYANKK